jgi:RNA polymerase sigma-70 factor (ECF subfamily)
MVPVVDTNPASGLAAQLAEYRPQIRRHLVAMVHDAETAEDLTQETYGLALAKLESLRDPKAGLAWLYRIATNAALDRYRRKVPLTVPLDGVTVGEVEAAAARERPGISLIEEGLERTEMSECIQGYLQALSDDHRVAILLHDVYGLTNPEVAALVGCSLPTAKIRVHRAHERLRDTLRGACDFHIDDRGVLVCGARPPGPPALPARG